MCLETIHYFFLQAKNYTSQSCLDTLKIEIGYKTKTINLKNSFLHIRGHLKGSNTIYEFYLYYRKSSMNLPSFN